MNTTLIRYIVTHTRPHLDEAAGVAMLRLYRPDIIATNPDYTFVGIGRLGSQSQKEKEDESVLYLGVMGGNADEHLPGRENECSATLVAKHYGIFEIPAVQVVLRPVLRMDRKGPHADEIAAAMIHVARYAGIDDRKVFEWGILAVSAMLKEAEEVVANAPASGPGKCEPKVSVKTETVIYYVRKHFPDDFSTWAETLELADRGRATERAEAEKLAKVVQVHIVGHRKVVVVEGTENREIANACRDFHQHDIVVVLRPSGMAQILTSGRSASGSQKINLLPLLVDLRRKEVSWRGSLAKANGKAALPALSAEEEVLPNSLETCPWWFGHVVDDGQRIGSVFNGTQDAASQVETTALTRDQILGAVRAFAEGLVAETSRQGRPAAGGRQQGDYRGDRRSPHGGGHHNGRRHHTNSRDGHQSGRRPTPPAGPRQKPISTLARAFEEVVVTQ